MSNNNFNFFVQDWAKPGPYDQPMVNTLRRRKAKDTSAGLDSNSSSWSSGQASTSAPSPQGLKTSGQSEERNGVIPAAVKVSFSRLLLSPAKLGTFAK